MGVWFQFKVWHFTCNSSHHRQLSPPSGLISVSRSTFSNVEIKSWPHSFHTNSSLSIKILCSHVFLLPTIPHSLHASICLPTALIARGILLLLSMHLSSPWYSHFFLIWRQCNDDYKKLVAEMTCFQFRRRMHLNRKIWRAEPFDKWIYYLSRLTLSIPLISEARSLQPAAVLQCCRACSPSQMFVIETSSNIPLLVGGLVKLWIWITGIWHWQHSPTINTSHFIQLTFQLLITNIQIREDSFPY